MKITLALVGSLTFHLCNGRALDSIERFTRRQSDSAQPNIITVDQDPTNVVQTTIDFDSGQNHFTLGFDPCLDTSTKIGSWIDRYGRLKADATYGDIARDIETTRTVANIPVANPSKADAAVKALVVKNAQAACERTTDILKDKILCPNTQTSREELRRLLVDTGNRYRAIAIGAGVQFAAGAGNSLIGSSNMTANVKALYAGAINAASYVACAVVDHAADTARFTQWEAKVAAVVTSTMLNLAEKAAKKWDELKRNVASSLIDCLSPNEAKADTATLDGATDSSLGLSAGTAQNPGQRSQGTSGNIQNGQLPGSDVENACV